MSVKQYLNKFPSAHRAKYFPLPWLPKHPLLLRMSPVFLPQSRPQLFPVLKPSPSKVLEGKPTVLWAIFSQKETQHPLIPTPNTPHTAMVTAPSPTPAGGHSSAGRVCLEAQNIPHWKSGHFQKSALSQEGVWSWNFFCDFKLHVFHFLIFFTWEKLEQEQGN